MQHWVHNLDPVIVRFNFPVSNLFWGLYALALGSFLYLLFSRKRISLFKFNKEEKQTIKFYGTLVVIGVFVHWLSVSKGLFGNLDLQIRWYGLMYLVGFVLAFLQFRYRYYKGYFALNPEQSQTLITYVIIGMMIFARLTYVFVYNPMHYFKHPEEIIRIWEGGLSFHGAAIGFIISVLFFARQHKLTFYHIMDSVVLTSAVGIFLGRVGNFINGELAGRVTDVSWGIVFPHYGQVARHPSQLYQSMTEGLLLFLILIWIEARERRLGYAPKAVDRRALLKEAETKTTKQKEEMMIHWKRTGILSNWFLILYGIGRFIVEFYRQPDEQLGYFFGIFSMGQILCTLMIIGGVYLLRRAVKNPIPQSYL